LPRPITHQNEEPGFEFDTNAAVIGAISGAVAFFVASLLFKRCKRNKDNGGDGFVRANDHHEPLL